MAHWRKAGVRHFIVHAELQHRMEYAPHGFGQPLGVVQIHMAAFTFFRSVLIRGDIRSADHANAVVTEISSYGLEEQFFVFEMNVFDDIERYDGVKIAEVFSQEIVENELAVVAGGRLAPAASMASGSQSIPV